MMSIPQTCLADSWKQIQTAIGREVIHKHESPSSGAPPPAGHRRGRATSGSIEPGRRSPWCVGGGGGGGSSPNRLLLTAREQQGIPLLGSIVVCNVHCASPVCIPLSAPVKTTCFAPCRVSQGAFQNERCKASPLSIIITNTHLDLRKSNTARFAKQGATHEGDHMWGCNLAGGCNLAWG